jgi:glycosyltransferase involved in cell wall biosynthesis
MQRAEGMMGVASAAATARPQVAVLIPCFNEALTIGKVIADFRAAIPRAAIYVYDNNSTDATIKVAQESGAVVRRETRQGKGHVVRRMFRDIDVDVYVLVDGDATYDAASAGRLTSELVEGHFDMAVGVRSNPEQDSYRAAHQFGNRLLTGFVATVFGKELRDMLSGYRVLSRRFVKSFPQLSSGFEIETELTIHALELELPMIEVATPYYARPAGSASKLNTWRDGVRILLTILHLYRSERPLAFFTIVGCWSAALSVVLAIPIFITFMATGLVPRIPTAILSTGLMILAFLSIAIGFVLDTVTRGRREMKLLAYLAQPPPER